jgi:short-subunit dehydrogenase
MHPDVGGKAVLITGAARGIGAETARQLAGRGARLALVGLEPERLHALAAALGPAHVAIEADVSDTDAVRRAVAAAVEHLGGLDVVVANAGIADNATVAVTPVEAQLRTIDVNLGGAVRTVSAALPHVTERRGYVLAIASAAAFSVLPGLAAYAASKAGIEQFCNALRLEVAHKGVAIGVAYPAWIDTDMVRDAREDLPAFDSWLARLPGPLSRTTSVETCAAALVDGIARRRERIYVPRSVAALQLARAAMTGRTVGALVRRDAAARVPAVEAEALRLGRFFGRHSVETRDGARVA